MPLYRALNVAEIEAGYVLIPKSQAPFRAPPRLPNELPFTLSETEENAAREHQWDGKFPARGVSCTTKWTVAVRYAAKKKIMVCIDESKCERFGVRRIRVCDIVPLKLIIHPEDEEVILVFDKDGALPKEIISEVIDVSRGPAEA